MGDRIIFLDFDGVLNTSGFLVAVAAAEVGEMWLDPARVRLVSDLARTTGARVVLATSWRYAFSLDELEGMLRRRGYEGAFAGMTPKVEGARGDEIRAWFDAHAKTVTHWVAIDDATEAMGWLGERHVLTTMESGLTAEHVQRALRWLAD